MKKLAIAFSALALSAATASAADLPVKAPLPPPLAPITWTGWYVGFNLGGIWPNNNGVSHVAFAGPCNAAFGGCASVPNYSSTLADGSTFLAGFGNTAGFTGGGQFGY